MADRFELVPFEDHHILTARNADGVHVVMKPIVEALGLTWHGQFERIRRHPVLAEGVRVTRIPSTGGAQDAVTLGLEQFHGWLVTLSPDRIADLDKRETIIRYQRRAFRVIFEHFHGPIGQQRLNLQSVTSRVAAQNQALRLVTRLRDTRDPAERRLIHQLLQSMCAELGVPAPLLEEIGRDAPTAPDILGQFWAGVDLLRGRGVEVDHSRDPALIAISLTDLRRQFGDAGLSVTFDTPLRRALRQSTAPRYVDTKSINSRLTLGSKACWVFAV